MICYGHWVWEGTSTETKPDEAQGAFDGHIFKELDTGESYTRIAGEWTFINTGLSFIKATKSGRIITDANGIYDIVFRTANIDDDYTVALSTKNHVQEKDATLVYFSNLTQQGFRITSRDIKGQIKPFCEVSWLMTRDFDPVG